MLIRQSETSSERRAFTFLELMVVVAILAILILFALPNMAGTRDKTALRTAARQLAAAGMLARQMAISYGEETTLTIRPATNKWQLELTPEAREKRAKRRSSSRRDEEADTEDEQEKDLPQRITFNSIKTNNVDGDLTGETRIVFYPNGSCSGATVEVKNVRDKSMTIDFERATARADVYTGPPKSIAARMKEQGLDPTSYGIPDDAPEVALNEDAPGAGFSKTAGQSSDERVEAYKDAVERMLQRSQNRYEVTKSGNANDFYSNQDAWGKK